MDILKKKGEKNNDEGFSIMEPLVSIIIAGIVVTFSIILYNSVISESSVMHKSEALLLAKECIDNAVAGRMNSDTVYFNKRGNMRVERKAVNESRLYRITVNIYAVQKNKSIIHLEVLSRR